jgi:hypothetical protein
MLSPGVIFRSRFMTAWRHPTTLSAIPSHELLETYGTLDLDGAAPKNLHKGSRLPAGFNPFAAP